MKKSDFVDKSKYDAVRLLNTILNMYYIEDLNQVQIAKRLGLSTSKVNRMLQQAREEGFVEINIRTPFQHLVDLETRLKAIFGLADAIVIPPVPEDTNNLAHSLGRVGAEFLLRHVRDGDIICIGGGTAVHAVVEAIQAPRAYSVEVVPFLGAVQGDVSTDVNFLAARLAERLGGKAYQLHAPAFAGTATDRDILMEMRPVKEILDIARRARFSLMGIGTIDGESSRYVKFTALSPDDMRRIAEVHGGVGEIGAHVFDATGVPCAEEYSARVIGLTLEEIKCIPVTISLAVTLAKVRSLYGALRGGYLRSLVTDEAAARGLLALFERDFHQTTGDEVVHTIANAPR